MPELEPTTREEKFLNGEVGMTPITREEKILAGEDIETVTRREYFLKKYRGGGGGDVTVVPLSVTENGTYSEEGKAYSPVSVNVPLPSNAFLLKSVTTPTSIASFNDGEEMVMPTLKVAIEPQQDLHGYDHPWAGGAGKNKFGIKEWLDTNGITYTQNGNSYTFNLENKLFSYKWEFSDTDIATNFKATITIPSGSTASNVGFVLYNQSGTVVTSRVKEYSNKTGCKIGLDWSSLGQVTITEAILTKSTDSVTPFAPYSNICPISGWDEVDLTVADDVDNPTVSNAYTIDLDGTRYGVDLDVINGIGREYKEYPSYNGETLIGPWISDRDAYAEGTTPTIGAQVVDKGDISTFNTIPTAVKSLRGVNNVYANTGDITDAEYFSKEV